jgi:motility quorum-sensing regulator/GCU-specific mRNA interferase toxin
VKPITKTPKGGTYSLFLPVKKHHVINQLGYNCLMEKHTPHCKLSVIKTLIENGNVRSTVSALKGAAALGFDFADMLNVINALTPADFYKSMTTHADHRVWQDVYHTNTDNGEVYLKLTVIADVLIVSFKEL